MAVFLKDPRPKHVAIPPQATVITVSSASNGTVRDVTVFGAKKSMLCRPTTLTQDPMGKSFKSAVLLGPGNKRPYSVPIKIEPEFENNNTNTCPSTTVVLPTSKQKIPRPPNAFMLFAHDWRRQLAHQYPKESNKDISIRLGKMWKTLPKMDKERYFQSAREVDAEHKKKFPDYVYNPKEARMRKALREQSRGERQVQGGGPPPRWIKQTYNMNHRQSIVSPIMLAQQQRRLDDNKATIREQVERDTGMLQNFPDYLDLSYPGLNIPSNPNEYSVFTDIDGQPWCPYLQTPMQSSAAYLMRNNEIKVPTSWSLSTDYNSDQSNFMQPSPQDSPYQHTSHQPQTDPLLLNGNHQPSEAETAAAAICLPLEPKVEHNLAINNEPQPSIHMPEYPRTPERREMDGSGNDIRTILPNNYLVSPASTNFMSSPSIWSSLLYCSPNKQADPSIHLHSTNNSSQEAILPDFIDYGLLQASEFIPAQQESDNFSSFNFNNQRFKQNEIDTKYEMDYSNFELNLDCTTDTSLSQNMIVPQMLSSEEMFNTNDKPGFVETRSKNECDNRFHNLMTSEEFAPQDLGKMSSLNRPPVIISQNDKICVVLESSGIDSDIKEFTSL